MHDLDMLCEGMPPFLNKVAVLTGFTIFGVNLHFMTHLGWLLAPYPQKKGYSLKSWMLHWYYLAPPQKGWGWLLWWIHSGITRRCVVSWLRHQCTTGEYNSFGCVETIHCCHGIVWTLSSGKPSNSILNGARWGAKKRSQKRRAISDSGLRSGLGKALRYKFCSDTSILDHGANARVGVYNYSLLGFCRL